MTEDRHIERGYYGYNPDFYRRAQARRRREARQEALRREREEAAAKEQRRIQAELAAQDRAAMERQRHESDASDHIAAQDSAANDASAPSRKPAVEIVREVCVSFGVRFADVIGDSREFHVVRARQHAMYRLRSERPDLSFTQIARIFRKDHTTVIHSVRKVAAEMAA